MYTPSEDEPGTVPLVIVRDGIRGRTAARAQNAPSALPAEPMLPAEPTLPAERGERGDGTEGIPGSGRRLLPWAGLPWTRLPWTRLPWAGLPWAGWSWAERSWARRPWAEWHLPRSPWAKRLVRCLIWLTWPVAVAAAGVGLYLCYLAVSRTEAVTSDGASNALQAWAMLHGNPLLRGWTLTDVSFYTTELPEYMIVEAIRGLNADVLHVSAAITYTLVVLTGGLLGRGRARGREGVVRFAIAAGIMVAPQLGPGVFILVFQPDHTGTQVPLLLTLLALDRLPRSWYVPIVVALMLAWGAIADSLVLIIGAAPLAAVSAVRAYQILVQRREGLRRGWFDLSLLVAAAASVEITKIVLRDISHHGGYTVLPVENAVAPVTEMSSHLWLLVQSICGLYGADVFGMSSLGLAAAIALLHLVGLGLAGWALWLVIRRFFSCEDRIAQVLALGILVNLAAYLLSTTPTTYWSAREVAPVLSAGAVLAARMLGPRLRKVRLVPALSLVLACYLAALGYTVAQPSVPAVSQDLADYLAAHHLTYGLSSYGLANTTTLASGETVDLRSVSWENNNAAGGPYEFEPSWYDPLLHDANFVVLINPPIPLDPIAYWEVLATFGKPQHIYYFGRYEIMTWNTNLLFDLSPSLPATTPVAPQLTAVGGRRPTAPRRGSARPASGARRTAR
jgi:hypothetical protein